jgi:hypothetical protein
LLIGYANNASLSNLPNADTYYVSIEEENLMSSLPPPILYVSGTPLQLVSSARYLGIELTQDLSWSLHISHLCAKAMQATYWILLYHHFYKHANTDCLTLDLLQLIKYCIIFIINQNKLFIISVRREQRVT